MKYMKMMALMLMATTAVMAQTKEEKNEAQRQYHYNYSRWSIGLHGGLAAAWGDFATLSDEKFYLSPMGGVSVGFQINPSVGLTLEGSMASIKAAALSSNADYYLNTNGFRSITATNTQNPTTEFAHYGELYSKMSLIQGRLGLDLNLSNLFSGNRAEKMRRWTVIFSPSYYLQYYRPTVYMKNNDKRYTTRDLFYSTSHGVGGEMALRYHASRLIDLQLKAGGVYGFNKKFEGVVGDKNTNILAYTQVGIIFKLNGRNKRNNLMYAATPKFVPSLETRLQPEEPRVIERIVHDTVYVTRPHECQNKSEVVQIGRLPYVSFRRGKAEIEENKYRSDLEGLVNLLKTNQALKVDIRGWADHTGSDDINSRLTQQRANALANYLTKHGIPANRIISIKGMGKDTNLSGQEALGPKARRAEALISK